MSTSNPPVSNLASAVLPDPEEGAIPSVRTALQQHPELAHDRSLVIDLAFDEYCRRLEAGENLDPAAFCRRFTAIQHSLRELIDAHHFFQANPHLLPTTSTSAWPQSGEPFLGFRLERELGRGAFARVFLATEPALGHRRVAVKVTPCGTLEAETIGRLDHPNIVPVYSVQHDAATGLTAICMPYLGSATLNDVLDRHLAGGGVPAQARAILAAISAGTRDLEKATSEKLGTARPWTGSYVDGVLHLAVQMADGLAFVHAQGIHHRDLKPSNVLLAHDGRPMLLDFNLSHDSQADQDTLGGTPPYMAPEQLLAMRARDKKNAPAVGARADLFSLGVILYELLTGTHPFGPLAAGEPITVLCARLVERHRQGCRGLRKLNPRVDRELARLVESCLSYDPQDRPESAGKLAAELRALQSPAQRCRRWLAGRAWSVATSVLLVGALAGIGVYAVTPVGTYPERQLNQGLELSRQGDYLGALPYLGRAIEADASSAAAHFARGRVYHRLREHDLAIADYRRADELNPSGVYKACRAYCLTCRGLYWDAIALNREALAMGFASAAVYNNLGYCYLATGKLDQAHEALTQAVQLDDSLQAAFHNRARVDRQRMLLRDEYIPVQGIADIRRALQIGPAEPDHCLDAAYLCAHAAQFDKTWTDSALVYLQQAIQLGESPEALATNPCFSKLVHLERFQEILANTAPQQARRNPVLLLDPATD